MPKFLDLTSRKFGRLVVIQRAENDKWGSPCWLCRCDCKKIKIVRGAYLKNGVIRSCGCLFREGNNIKHGYYRKGKVSKIYQSWRDMIKRCTNPNNASYQYYGGRGIKVCKRWINSFENFYKDMGKKPEGHQIDRINNNGNYCKSNCRWVTPKINNRNRRSSCLITHAGKTQCLKDWAEEFDINYTTLHSRVIIYNWTIEKALTTPVRKIKNVSAHM